MATGPQSGHAGLCRRACADQISMVRLFLSDRRLRAPVVAIWVASFGGALHEPVTTFFMLELGASPAQMGKFGVIRSIGTWVLGPAYGWLIDKYTAFTPTLISAFVCALGCTLRGLAPVGRVDLLYVAAAVLGLGAANFWNVVQAHLAYATDSELRHKVITAYFVQVKALSLLGKSVYPLWDAGLKAAGLANEKLLRYRITMSICSLFCVFGVFNLAVNGRGMQEVSGHSKEEGEEEEKEPAVNPPQPEERSWGDLATFLAVATVLVAQAAGQAAFTMLWPLYVSFQFGWQDHAYAWLSLTDSLACLLSASALPAVSHHVGAAAVATLLCGSASITVLLGFPEKALASTHVLCAVAFSACSTALKPCLEALASLAMPARVQGRSFAVLKLADALGQTLGSYLGSRLFSTSPGAPTLRWWLPQLGGGGALPFALVGASLLVSTSVLSVTLLPQHWGQAWGQHAGGGSGQDEDKPQRTISGVARKLSGLVRQRLDANRSTHPE